MCNLTGFSEKMNAQLRQKKLNKHRKWKNTQNGGFLKNGLSFYSSKKFSHFGWYVGIKRSGVTKNGRLTWYPWGQKAIQFVARKPYATPHPLRLLQNRHGLTLVINEDSSVKGKLYNL